MLKPIKNQDEKNKLRCYLWALLHCAQLEDFYFRPNVYKGSRPKRVLVNFWLIEMYIYFYDFKVDFFLPDSVWDAYFQAYDIPEEKRYGYYSDCPF
ncbi:hypothetical protein [Scytonema sp. NUACC26]|uniref:hypothetical protein n=1 Tax=Scytonema sp. NUACC26 TaxID=3140176 RepID=UPI0034DC7FCC